MSARVRTPLSEGRNSSSPSSSKAEFCFVEPDTEQGTSERKLPQTTSVPLSAKEQRMVDDFALLFTVQEERCLSRTSRESTRLSRASLTSSQLADASFIYQHVDFQVLSRCVPGFVKSHLNRNGRYLPETFILRVNYWRRRRALGEDSTVKKTAKENAAKENGKNSGDQANSSARVRSEKSGSPQSLSSKRTSLSGSRITMFSG